MVDKLRLERGVGLRLGAGRIERGGGERQRLDERTAAQLAGLEFVKLVGDETFRGDFSLRTEKATSAKDLQRLNAFSSMMLANWMS